MGSKGNRILRILNMILVQRNVFNYSLYFDDWMIFHILDKNLNIILIFSHFQQHFLNNQNFNLFIFCKIS